MKSMDKYKQEHQRLRDEYNASWAKTHKKKCPTCGAGVEATEEEDKSHRLVSKDRDRQIAELKKMMLADPDVAAFVCDKTVTFQAAKSYESNYDLSHEVEAKFPQGVGDTESGQGFFYINERFVEEVLEFLKGKVMAGCLGADVVHDTHGLVVMWGGKLPASIQPADVSTITWAEAAGHIAEALRKLGIDRESYDVDAFIQMYESLFPHAKLVYQCETNLDEAIFTLDLKNQ